MNFLHIISTFIYIFIYNYNNIIIFVHIIILYNKLELRWNRF